MIVNDDVAVENSTYTTGRGGVAGTLIVEKIVGAAAEQATISRQSRRSASGQQRHRSMGVALTSCTVPAAGKPTFQIGADEMEMGVGIHGEPGRRRVKLGSADEIAILKDLSLKGGARQRLRRHAAALSST